MLYIYIHSVRYICIQKERHRKTEGGKDRKEMMPENNKYQIQRIKMADTQRGSMSADVHDIPLTFCMLQLKNQLCRPYRKILRVSKERLFTSHG